MELITDATIRCELIGHTPLLNSIKRIISRFDTISERILGDLRFTTEDMSEIHRQYPLFLGNQDIEIINNFFSVITEKDFTINQITQCLQAINDEYDFPDVKSIVDALENLITTTNNSLQMINDTWQKDYIGERLKNIRSYLTAMAKKPNNRLSEFIEICRERITTEEYYKKKIYSYSVIHKMKKHLEKWNITINRTFPKIIKTLKNIDKSSDVIEIKSPIDTIWKDIKLHFTSELELEVFIKDMSIETRDYKKMHFENKKTHSPRTEWWKLLEFAIKNKVRLPYQTSDYSKRKEIAKEISAIEKQMQEIRKRLRSVFPMVTGDPVPKNKDGKGGAFYQAAFTVTTTPKVIDELQGRYSSKTKTTQELQDEKVDSDLDK